MPEFEVISVNISDKKGVVKTPVDVITLMETGVADDVHAGTPNRHVSMLGLESVDKMRAQGVDVNPGDFAENITTRGVCLYELPVGTRMTIGPCEVEVTQIGKKCHTGCAIFQKVGKCVMPKEGIFVKVIKGGEVRAQDRGTYDI
jgi:cyclic pyranopterin phosphate synthase